VGQTLNFSEGPSIESELIYHNNINAPLLNEGQYYHNDENSVAMSSLSDTFSDELKLSLKTNNNNNNKSGINRGYESNAPLNEEKVASIYL
jgi:hypothetical protein